MKCDKMRTDSGTEPSRFGVPFLWFALIFPVLYKIASSITSRK